MDFTISHACGYAYLHPHTANAAEWIDTNLPDDRPLSGEPIAMPPTMMPDVWASIEQAGLVVGFD